MGSQCSENSIESWLAVVQSAFEENEPELLNLFNIYAEEARFGRKYIDLDLLTLPEAANILEVGAGSLLLSCQLIREGFQVTSLEPIGNGFSHFDRMRNVILKVASELNVETFIVDVKAEDLQIRETFDYAFSINVMEHVDDVSLVIERVGRSLRENKRYRFTCPNYAFPYEPHFNIPTIFTKQLTEKLFSRKIYEHSMSDPKGTWESLNWIKVSSVKKIVRSRPELIVCFKQSMLKGVFLRMTEDEMFASRRSSIVLTAIKVLVFLRFHLLLSMVPASIQPVMDCIITKCNSKGVI